MVNSLEKVKQMEHNFKVGDFVESKGDRYMVTTPGVKCKIVKFIDKNKMDVEIVGRKENAYWRVEIKYFKLWEEPEEFEPITADNIREVLEYNGFTLIDSVHGKRYQDSSANRFIEYSERYFFKKDLGSVEHFIQHKDLNKVLDFMKEFIDLKPLPKNPVFDHRQFLLDNGFKIEEGLVITYKGICFGEFSLDEKELYFGKSEYALTKENLQKIVDAAKILEGME